MPKYLPQLLILTLLLSGCLPAIKPQVTGRNVVGADRETIMASEGEVTVSAKVQDLEYAPYRMVDNITSFQVTIENHTGKPLEFPHSSFLLVADDGQQFRPMKPGEVRDIVSRDSSYLIPYPYVGYYYLEDKERVAAANTFESSLPFYAENHPQDIFTQALPEETIVPEAKIAGLLYFVIDLTTKQYVDLRVYPGGDLTKNPDFSFRFATE